MQVGKIQKNVIGYLSFAISLLHIKTYMFSVDIEQN